MRGARQVWLVAAREMRERGRSRAFLVSVVLMILVVVGALVLPTFVDVGPGTKDVGLTGVVPAELPAVVQAQGEGVGTRVRIHRFDTIAAGEEAVRDGTVDVLVVDARQLEWRRRVDEQLKALVSGAIQLVVVRQRAVSAGIDPDALVAMVAPVPLESVELSSVAGRSHDDETAAFIMTLVLFGAVATYGAMVLTGVVEEKSSRVVEVLLARMPARNLLAGKIAGIGLLGLAQVAVTAAVAVVAGALVDDVDVPAVRGGVLAWAVVWFVVGYALYATVFGALGSLASRTEDAQSVTGPITVVLVAAYWVSFIAIGSAGTAWARLVSWFPATAPFAMPNRMAMGAASWWDPLVAVALTLATIAGLVVLGGRVYKRAILHTGATLRLRDVWRGAPGPAGGAARNAAPAAARSDRRTTTVLIALAALAGGMVIVLARDVVIGVAVGAAMYALAYRAEKRRGHAHR